MMSKAPIDATMRNVRAAHKRLDKLEAKVNRFIDHVTKLLVKPKRTR